VARIGVSITKSVSFRGGTQEFSNVYYYQTNLMSLPSESQALAAIDDITAAEKQLHSTQVTFVRGRLWSQEGSAAANNMIAQKNLSGTGARNVSSGFDRERAYLVRLRAGTDSRGQPVYLRKWYHSCGFIAAISLSTQVMEQTAQFSTADKALIVAAVAGLKTLTIASISWKLCSKSGRDFGSGEEFQSHNYLEHHQLGDMWRAQ
jgi:hypothetical protein